MLLRGKYAEIDEERVDEVRSLLCSTVDEASAL